MCRNEDIVPNMLILRTVFLMSFSLGTALALAQEASPLPAAPSETVAAAAKPRVEQPTKRLNTQGFYPLWESTGYVQPEKELFASTIGVQYGFENEGHVGVMPVSYLYRTPNFYVKHRLMTDPNNRWQLAVQANLYYVLRGAARSLFSPVYTSRLDNSDFGFVMLPVALAGSYALKNWWLLHGTFTAMGIFGGGMQNGVESGLSLVSEFRAFESQSLLLHLGEVGFWSHDFWYTGVSYRYRSDSFEFRLGYFYRTFVLGTQSGPMISVGFLL